jgi:23S rRNA pseudouridine2605 synthase
LDKKDFERLLTGVTLEDGFVAPDALGYADARDKKIIGIEIHSGRNRIVRRMFEFLGYDVKNLDRVLFANLTKKNVDRGKWRYLNEKEVRLLKFLNKSFVKKKEEQQGKNRDEE